MRVAAVLRAPRIRAIERPLSRAGPCFRVHRPDLARSRDRLGCSTRRVCNSRVVGVVEALVQEIAEGSARERLWEDVAVVFEVARVDSARRAQFLADGGVSPGAETTWSEHALQTLAAAVTGHVTRQPDGAAIWALGKAFDPGLVPVFRGLLARLLGRAPIDAHAVYQTLIALDNCGERLFGDRRSASVTDIEANLATARAYLAGERSPP
jgi:hypothetical protein